MPLSRADEIKTIIDQAQGFLDGAYEALDQSDTFLTIAHLSACHVNISDAMAKLVAISKESLEEVMESDDGSGFGT